MKILKIEDQEDGSAIVDIEITPEENNFFIEYAIVDILTKQMERNKDEDNIRTAVSDT